MPLNSHLIWQATNSYVECGDAFGLIPHEGVRFGASGTDRFTDGPLVSGHGLHRTRERPRPVLSSSLADTR
jgi:hypothetical protein